MLTWNGIDHSMKMKEISRAIDKKLLVNNNVLGKSWICGLFMVCMAILYPGIAIGIVSGNGNQARMVIKQKIEGELIKNENIRREIQSVKAGTEDCIVNFKNGSSIRAITLGLNQKGDNARGKLQLLLRIEICEKQKRENCWKCVKSIKLQHNTLNGISVNV